MASRYPEIDIMPKAGIALGDPSGVEWVANLWRINRETALQIRPGFGQVTQNDATTMQSTPGGNPVGGFQEHLGSFAYTSDYGHRQVLSVFRTVMDTTSLTQIILQAGYDADLYIHNTIGGFADCVTMTIYDLTTSTMWEEPLVAKTNQRCLENADIPGSYGFYETRQKFDQRGYTNVPQGSVVTFVQVGDSVVIAGGTLGTWVYHGIDVSKAKQRKIYGPNGNNTGTASVYTGYNNSTGESEGSVCIPIGGTRGINGDDSAYLTRAEFPRPDAVAYVAGRVVYGARNIIFFSDVNQPGSIQANNFISIQTDTDIQALAQYNGVLYGFTEQSTHLFQLRPNVNVGETSASLVSAIHVPLSDLIGAVSQAATVETPFGVCWISHRGVHIIGGNQAISDLSDPIHSFWDGGIVDPVSNYYAASGVGGSNAQPSIVYKHHGKPTIAYDRLHQTLVLSYPDCLLIYQFRTQGWSIWPVGTVQASGVVQRNQTIAPLQVLADDQNVFLVGGLTDKNFAGATPAAQPPSFHLLELGRGGAMDRSCKTEDHRLYGWGKYAAKRAPASSSSIDHHYRFYVNEPRRIFHDRTNAKICYEVQVDFETLRDSTATVYYPADTGAGTKDALELVFQFHADWDLEGSVGIFAESAPYSDFDFLVGPTSVQIYRSFGGSTDPRPVGTRMPLCLLRFYASDDIDVVPTLSVSKARIHPVGGGGTYKDIVGYVWEPIHRYATANSTNNNRLATSVQWGYRSGQVGLDQGVQIRSRGLYADLITHGSPNGSLYNTFLSSDHKLRSGQYPDYTSPTVANKRAADIETVRERMANSGKRLFANASDATPKYSGGASSASERYLIDSEELNTIATSQSARGEQLAAMIYGFADDKADFISFERLKMTVLEVGNRRRKGR